MQEQKVGIEWVCLSPMDSFVRETEQFKTSPHYSNNRKAREEQREMIKPYLFFFFYLI